MALYQPIDYTGGVSQFDTLKSGFELGQNLFRNQQAARINEFNLEKAKRDDEAATAEAAEKKSREQSFRNFLATANTREELIAGAKAHPEYYNELSQQMGIMDEGQRERIFNFTNQLELGLKLKETDPVQGNMMIARTLGDAKNAPILENWGVTGDDALRLLDDPAQAEGIVRTMRFASLPRADAIGKKETVTRNEEVDTAQLIKDYYSGKGIGAQVQDNIGTMPKETATSMKIRDAAQTAAFDLSGQSQGTLSLAGRVRNFKNFPSGLKGTATDILQKYIGVGEEDYRQLTQQITNTVNSALTAGLPKGSASDKDVALIRAGLPESIDDPKIIAEYLDALGRTQLRLSKLNNFKSQWMENFVSTGRAFNDAEIDGFTVNRGDTYTSSLKKYMESQEEGMADTISSYSQTGVTPAGLESTQPAQPAATSRPENLGGFQPGSQPTPKRGLSISSAALDVMNRTR